MSVADRLLRSEESRRSKLAARRADAAEAARVSEEALIFLTRRSVSRREASKTTARLHDESVRQRALKAHDREKARIALEALRDGVWESTFRPRLSSVAASRRQSDVPVEDRLTAVGARLREARRAEAQRAKAQATADARPRITTKAAALDRTDLDVSSRLYLDARISAVEKNRKKQEEKVVASRDRKGEARSQALFLDAKRRDEAMKSKREREARRQAAKTKLPISKMSEMLAGKHKITPAERLVSSEKSRKQQLIAEMIASSDASSPKDKIAGDDADAGAGDRKQQSKLFEEARRAANRRKAKQIEADLSELDGCTFRPNMSSSFLLDECDDEDINARSQRWLRKRQEKLETQLRAQEREEVEGCTFSPYRVSASR